MRIAWLSVLIAIIPLLAACKPSGETTPVPATESLVAGQPPTDSLSPGISPAPTYAPPLPESLTTKELHARLDPFALDAECELPCYVGLVPGQTNTKETLVFYSKLGIGVNDFIPGDIQRAQSGNGHLGAWLTKTSDVIDAEALGLAPPVADIYLENDIVQYGYIGWQYAPGYLTLTRIIENLGYPSHIDVGLDFTKETTTYIFQMIYPDTQVGFLFSGITHGDSQFQQICYVEPEVDVTYLGIFAPESEPMAGLPRTDKLTPLEEALDIAAQDFINAVASQDCVPIPSNIWTLWE